MRREGVEDEVAPAKGVGSKEPATIRDRFMMSFHPLPVLIGINDYIPTVRAAEKLLGSAFLLAWSFNNCLLCVTFESHAACDEPGRENGGLGLNND